MEPLYQINVECLQCQRAYQTSRVRPSFKKVVKTDTDFCTYYKEGNENPDYYVVKVCPYCGFASTDSFGTRLSEQQKAAFHREVSSIWKMKDYGGKRTPDSALLTYKLALLSAQTIGERPRVIAGILHHIAWLYRHRGDLEGETRFLQYAVDAYTQVYETEEKDLTGARLMFMIGELHRRLKNYSDAVKWFSRVINDKRITDAGMIRACREGWSSLRDDMLAAQMELPEEMKQSAGM